jgi:hypothetical protein
MDSTAARFFELDVYCGLGEERDAGGCVCGAVVGPEEWAEDDGGTITMGRGAAGDDACCESSSGFLRERPVAIRWDSPGEGVGV